MNEHERDHPRIAHQSLREFTEQASLSAGFTPDDSARATDVLLWASLRGVDTHGVRNLKRYYVDCAGGIGQRDGVILADAKPTVEHEASLTAAWNANGALGLSVSAQAMESAMEKAAEHGFGAVTVRNSTQFGAAGYYAHMAVESDMCGFASTGYLFANGQEKAVLPFGGLLPMLSTNPIAFAFPGEMEPPFILDMSTSVVPVNRIEMFEELGKTIPLGWALDREHEATDDPKAVHKVAPLGGAVEFGGHKGYGLALASWVLTGLMSGAWRTDANSDRVLGQDKGKSHGYSQEGVAHCFAAIRLDQFGDPSLIKRGLDSMIRTLNESPPAAGFEQVLSPGQKEHAALADRSKNGIPISGSPLADLRSLEEEFGVQLSLDED